VEYTLLLPLFLYRQEELYVEVERIVDSGKHDYASISEFVKNAVRRRLEEIARLKEASPTK